MRYVNWVGALVGASISMSSYAADTITIRDAFAYATPAKVGVAYFTAISPQKASITGIASDCCKAVELHRTEKLNGVMTMRRIAQATLKKATPFEVQPTSKGGEHVMLIGLKQPLVAGERVSLTFTFGDLHTQTVSFPIINRGGATAAHTTHERH